MVKGTNRMKEKPMTTTAESLLPRIARGDTTITGQEIFEAVVTHLVSQGVMARSSYCSCTYRSPKGLKCAIGCLIPDSAYNTDMEGMNSDQILDDRGAIFDSYFRTSMLPHRQLLLHLQNLHDDSEFMLNDSLLQRAKMIGDNFGLDSEFMEHLNTCNLRDGRYLNVVIEERDV